MVGPVLSRALWTGRRLTIATIRNQFKMPKCNLQARSASTASFLDPEIISVGSIQYSDPYAFVHDDVKDTFADLRTELTSSAVHLNEMISFYFDGQDKTRMSLILLMARALNNHAHGCESILLPKQRLVAMVAEMFYVGGRLHKMSGAGENKINLADSSSSQIGSQEILLGDYIFCSSLILLARTGYNAVYGEMSKILGDKVQGEFMQDKTSSTSRPEDDTLFRYLQKAFNKTGSLMAASCKSVAMLAGAEPQVQEMAFEFGRNAGISYQIAKDAGLCKSSKNVFVEGDVRSRSKTILGAQETSDMLENYKYLAHQHCAKAIRILDDIRECPEKEVLISLTKKYVTIS